MQPNETKTFTPGPWRLQIERDGLQVCASDGRVIYSARWVSVSPRAKTVEDVRNGVGFHPLNRPPFDTESAVRAVAQQIADFTLITAAPDLYAALEGLAAQMASLWAPNERGDPEPDGKAIDAAYAALRRARGEG